MINPDALKLVPTSITELFKKVSARTIQPRAHEPAREPRGGDRIVGAAWWGPGWEQVPSLLNKCARASAQNLQKAPRFEVALEVEAQQAVHGVLNLGLQAGIQVEWRHLRPFGALEQA